MFNLVSFISKIRKLFTTSYVCSTLLSMTLCPMFVQSVRFHTTYSPPPYTYFLTTYSPPTGVTVLCGAPSC